MDTDNNSLKKSNTSLNKNRLSASQRRPSEAPLDTLEKNDSFFAYKKGIKGQIRWDCLTVQDDDLESSVDE